MKHNLYGIVHPRFAPALVVVLAVLSALSLAVSQAAAASGKEFTNPEEAVAALKKAVSAKDQSELRAIFGPEIDTMENPDRVQGTNEFNQFAAAMDADCRLVQVADSTCILEIGADHWPFSIPLVQRSQKWVFDVGAGKDELLSRRIGANELATLRTMRACVEAQREYASRDRDGDEVLEYAQKLISSAGTTDGLYWPTELNGEISPLGPLVAQAQGQGYPLGPLTDPQAPVPYQGYYFKILTRQGKHAPGRKYDYVINGNMIGGFALVAWPAVYGQSGIMTFIVNQGGRVYEKDLGPKTAQSARSMKAYDPDNTWSLSQD